MIDDKSIAAGISNERSTDSQQQKNRIENWRLPNERVQSPAKP